MRYIAYQQWIPAFAGMTLFFCVLASPAAAAPTRVLSANLCADQLLLALAKPDHILAVSWMARDPALSAVSGQVTGYPSIRGETEEIIQLQPDAVLLGAEVKPALRELLTRQRIAVRVIDMPQTIFGVERQVDEVADWLGEAETGQRLIAEMNQRLDGAALHCATPPRVVFYYPNGFTDGEGTLTHEVLERVGVRNLAAEAGVKGIGYLPLERLTRAKPDLIFISRYDPNAPTQGDAVFTHPALEGLAHTPKVEVPGRLLICENHHIAELAALVSQAVREAGLCSGARANP